MRVSRKTSADAGQLAQLRATNVFSPAVLSWASSVSGQRLVNGRSHRSTLGKMRGVSAALESIPKSGDEIKSVWVGPEKCWSAVEESKLFHGARIGTGT